MFWSVQKDIDVDLYFSHLLKVVPQLGIDRLCFALSFCDLSKFEGVQDSTTEPYYLKCLKRLVRHIGGLGRSEASLSNTLIINNVPFRNVLNDPYWAIHPTSFKYAFERDTNKESYLIKHVESFLAVLMDSGLAIPLFNPKNPHVDTFKACFMLWNEAHRSIRPVHPTWALGFETELNVNNFSLMVLLKMLVGSHRRATGPFSFCLKLPNSANNLFCKCFRLFKPWLPRLLLTLN